MTRHFSRSSSVSNFVLRRFYTDYRLGMHACAGKNLAFLSLRTAVSAIVQNFVVDFAPGETGEEFDERFRDTFLMTLLPLQLQFTPRAEVHANIDS